MVDKKATPTFERARSVVDKRLRLDYRRRHLVTLTLSDVQLQGRLGAGEFADVYDVVVESNLMKSLQEAAQPMEAKVDDDDASTSSEDSACGGSGRSNMSREESLSHTIAITITETPSSYRRRYDQTLRTPYALKCIRPDVFDGAEHTQHSAMRDFLLEVELLTKLPAHPNIIQIAAISQDFFSNPAKGFTLIERLDETLEYRLKRWENYAGAQERNSNRKIWDITGKRKEKLHDQRHRLKCCAVGISKAMEHLHHHQIIYRDLKPANIGFAADGTVRLFDFGMARSVKEEQGEEELHFTGGAGSPRYMAPEVALNKNYGPSVDVYSCAMVLWQVCCLKKPFQGVTGMDDWFKVAVTLKKRPCLRSIASPELRQLIQACWDVNPQARPTFALVTHELERVITATRSR